MLADRSMLRAAGITSRQEGVAPAAQCRSRHAQGARERLQILASQQPEHRVALALPRHPVAPTRACRLCGGRCFCRHRPPLSRTASACEVSHSTLGRRSAVHGIHGQQPGVARERDAAEACAPALVGAPGGAVGAQGAGAAGAGGVAGGALVQVLQMSLRPGLRHRGVSRPGQGRAGQGRAPATRCGTTGTPRCARPRPRCCTWRAMTAPWMRIPAIMNGQSGPS